MPDHSKPTVWVPSPGAAHSSTGNEVDYWEALHRNLEFRRQSILPKEAERKRLNGELAAWKRAKADKLRPDETIGPPDPRRGRPRLK